MSADWVVNALVGLGFDPQEAADITTVFRAIREMPEPDALQIFIGVVNQTVEQAQAELKTRAEK